MEEAFATLIQRAFRQRRGKEIYSNKQTGYALSKPRVFLSSIKTKIGKINLEELAHVARGYDFYVSEVEGLQYIGARPQFRETANKPAVGAVNSTTSSIKLNFKMINPPQSATVFIYKTGSIVINTNGNWERVLRRLAQFYLKGRFTEMYDEVQITNVSSRFYCNHNINLEAIKSHIVSSIKEAYGGQIRAHYYGTEVPQRSTRFELFEHVGELGFSGSVRVSTEIYGIKVPLIISKNGTVIAASPNEQYGPIAFKKLIAEVGQTIFSEARAVPGAAKPKKEAKREAMAAARYNLATGWNATRNGHYVRPGPDGKPRFYSVPANKGLVRAKVIKAYSNAGVNIPANVISKLNITGEQINAVKGRTPVVGRPSGWNNQSRNGYYVRPNKQGKPQWYQIPKGKADARKTAVKAYAAAGVPIPPHIKALFKIGNANSNNAGKTPVINLGKDKHLRINGKQLERYNKGALVNLAVQLNLPRITEKMKVAEIRSEFQHKLAPKVQRINVTVNNVKHTFLTNGTVRRNYANKASRTRQFSTLKSVEQNAIARAYLKPTEYETYKKKLAKEKYQYLLNVKTSRLNGSPAAGPSAPVRVSPSPSNSNSPANANLELELELAVRMGNMNATPEHLATVKRAMGKLGVGPRGKPLKADVEAVWKHLIKNFKTKAQTNAAMAKLESRAVVPNWVPANKRNNFKRILIQTAATAKKKKNAKAAINAWINAQIPKEARIARNVENMMTGQMIHIPAWNPPREFKYQIPKLSPKVKSPRAAAAPKAKRSPSTKKKTIPMENNFENLVNNMNRRGVPYNANKAYSWANLKAMGINNKYKAAWYAHVK